LRVTAPVNAEFLGPIVGDFLKRYPEIRLELLSTARGEPRRGGLRRGHPRGVARGFDADREESAILKINSVVPVL